MPDERLRDDLQATLDARRELGPEYEAALVDSFMERLDAAIAHRVRAELELHESAPQGRRRSAAGPMIPLVMGSLALGIPLSGVAGANGGAAGLLIVWMAIVIINVAAAAVVMRRR